MKNYSIMISISLVVVLSILLSACGSVPMSAPSSTQAVVPFASVASSSIQAPAPTASSANQTAAPVIQPSAGACPHSTGARTYALVPKNLGDLYFDTANQGAQNAAKELGVTVLYKGSTAADANQEVQVLNSLIAQKVNGLAISANDANALASTGQAAMKACIPSVSWDSPIAKGGDQLFVNPIDAQGMGDTLTKLAFDITGPAGGKFAILSSSASAADQNAWITVIKADLQKPLFSRLQLMEVAYGGDDNTLSYQQAQMLMVKYPDLKVIVAPTSVSLVAAARAVKDANRVGRVYVTGLGTPNLMRDYVKSGVSLEFTYWDPSDLGYLTIYALDALATGKIAGKIGDSFSAGKLGSFTIVDSPNGPMIDLGKPTIFYRDNIDNFNF